MKQERRTGAKDKARSLDGLALSELAMKQGGLTNTRITPLPVKAGGSFQIWPLTLQHEQGQGVPVPMSSLPAGSRLYWLPVQFVESHISHDTPYEGERLQGCHKIHNAEPSSDEARRLTKRAIHAVEHSRYVYGPLVLDPSRHEVYVNGHEIELTLKEFGLLEYFLRHPGYVRTREMLLNAVWGYDYYGTTRTVDVHVRRIKKKIPFLTSAIISVHSLGYKLRDDGLGPKRSVGRQKPDPLEETFKQAQLKDVSPPDELKNLLP